MFHVKHDLGGHARRPVHDDRMIVPVTAVHAPVIIGESGPDHRGYLLAMPGHYGKRGQADHSAG